MNMYSNDQRLAAIIVAAGYSSRMQDFKPLLPLRDSTVIECTVDSFLRAGVEDVVVVIGHNADLIKPILDKKNIKWVYNSDYDEGMYTSIKAGLKALENHFCGFYMMPADIPFVKPETIIQLGEAFLKSDYKIVYPVYGGRREHPPVVSLEIRNEILTYDGTGGLKTLLIKYVDTAYHLEVEDETVLIDLDTPSTYEALKTK